MGRAGVWLLLGVAVGTARGFTWREAEAAALGFDPPALRQALERLQSRATTAILILRHDAVAAEWYAPGAGRTTPHYTASAAKAVVGGLGLALALDDGLLKIDDRVAIYVPQWRDDPRKAKITVRQLVSHTSGLADALHRVTEHDDLPAWMDSFWAADGDPFTIARDLVPVVAEPGTTARYSNPGLAMLGYVLGQRLRTTRYGELETYLRQRLMRPLGLPDEQWRMSYGKSWSVDGLTLRATWGGADYSPEALARLGRLLLRRGEWDGQRLLQPATVDALLTDSGQPRNHNSDVPNPISGLAWWLNTDGWVEGAPADAAFASGAGNQLLMIVPSLDLIVVRYGEQLDPGGFWEGVEKQLIKPLLTALTDAPPPLSPELRGVRFAPVEAIRRYAQGSDNWPLTADEEGTLYTAYGDGHGFEPRVERKLSLGLATITGPAEAPVGVNLRAPTIELLGDGARGGKASGLIYLDGVLYLLARNLDNARLAWSTDKGRTWEWGWRWTESFGCPTFINRGPANRDAGDEHVYVLSNDGPSAYLPATALVLARAPRAKLREFSAWEYFAGWRAGQPTWSPDIARRQAILRRPEGCLRSDAIYSQPLGRYLLALGFDHHGGWGLFEARQPWGPWREIWATSYWGLGQTHGYRLPPTWQSADGREIDLIFSGRPFGDVDYDALCIRRMWLETR